MNNPYRSPSTTDCETKSSADDREVTDNEVLVLIVITVSLVITACVFFVAIRSFYFFVAIRSFY